MPTDSSSPYLPFGENKHAAWFGKDIISVKQFSRADLEYVFGVAHEMRGMVERVGTFEGWKVKGKVRKVVLRGQVAFEDAKVLVEQDYGRNVRGYEME